MIIAVVLLHGSSLFSPKIGLPTREEITLAKTKKLTPVVVSMHVRLEDVVDGRDSW